jgi:hypothetical protein
LFGKDIVNRIFAEVFKLFVDPNVALKTAGDIFKIADDQAVREFIFGVTTRSLCAFRGSLGSIPQIYEDIFQDGPNSDALRYIFKERSQLADFLIDLTEPAKEFAVSTSSDGTPRGSNARELNEYNELNLHKYMNRYAVICQIQRLVKSIVNLFDGRQKAGDAAKLEMNTTLDTDTASDIIKSDGEGADFQKGKEEWFFINGIAGEAFWVKAACNRIAEVFQREVTGVLNRSEGFMWDMLECAGDQNKSAEGSNLLDSTESTRRAQKTLKEKLQASSIEQVVSIAHSQGCLVLRSVLQELQNDNQDLLQRLRVFTFGNPSRDWDFDLGHAEHFYNEKDFVAKIGVGRKGASDAYKGNIFTNSGHLFNAQYSFNPKHYGADRDASKLLACTDGSNPQALAVKKPKPKPKPEPQGDETSQKKPKPQPKPKVEPEPESESEPESEEEPEPEPERKPKPKPKPRAQPQAQASPARRPKQEPASEDSPATTPEY